MVSESARKRLQGSPAFRKYLRLVRHRSRRYAGTRGLFSSTPKSRNWTWDPRWPESLFLASVSMPISRISTSTIPAVLNEVLVRHALLARHGRRRSSARRHSLSDRTGGNVNSENLPETHEILKKHPIRARWSMYPRTKCCLRKPISGPRTSSSILATGMNATWRSIFPLMPRMYMAIAKEDRFPITDILRQTPAILPFQLHNGPIFLRNHDELTLEMVTVRGARLSVGPLMHRRPPCSAQSRHQTEACAAAATRPATDRADERPSAVYAWHAGDLLWRRDRHGRQRTSSATGTACRTPMQWTEDRNAGFSRADPGQAWCCRRSWIRSMASQAVNVEAQA